MSPVRVARRAGAKHAATSGVDEVSWPAAVMDRAVGAVVASAAGDALGAPYEFHGPNPAAPCELEGGGQLGWEPGEWTDDTQMALAVLTPLADGASEPDRIGTAMLDWYRSHPRDVGIQTRGVLGDADRSGDTVWDAAVRYQQRHPDAAGNGALMRTGPVALGHLGDPAGVASLAIIVASATHPHPDSVDACALWSMAIERAITTARPDQRFDFVEALLAGLERIEANRRDEWRERITGRSVATRPSSTTTTAGSSPRYRPPSRRSPRQAPTAVIGTAPTWSKR